MTVQQHRAIVAFKQKQEHFVKKKKKQTKRFLRSEVQNRGADCTFEELKIEALLAFN